MIRLFMNLFPFRSLVVQTVAGQAEKRHCCLSTKYAVSSNAKLPKMVLNTQFMFPLVIACVKS